MPAKRKFSVDIGLFSIFIFYACFAMGQSYNEVVKVVASDREASDEYGYSVSISGDYAIVGAFKEDHDVSDANFLTEAGAAYILEKDGSGNWVEVQKIVASDRASYEQFGYSVAISSSYVVVGAHKEFSNRGAAYVFERDGAGDWLEVEKIAGSDLRGNDYFGNSVSISGNYIIVGAFQANRDLADENDISNAGAAYIFERDGSGSWLESQKLVASDRAAEDLFGFSVAISGSYAIIGAYQEDEDEDELNTLSSAGSVYIFYKDGSGNFSEISKHTASDRDAGDQYGYSVAIYSTYAIVGANKESEDADNLNTASEAGSAYILERDGGGTWSEVQKIVASDREASDEFGSSVAISSIYAVVGASKERISAGAAYVFDRNSSGEWMHLQKRISSDRVNGDQFGASVALSGYNMIVGANGEDHDESGANNQVSAGSAYLFEYENNRPVFTSSGSISIAENIASGTFVLDVNANNGDGGATDERISYSILARNEDDLLFDIDSESGQLTIEFSPDFENPSDEDMNNVYFMQVRAYDGISSTNQFVYVTITDIDESIVWSGSAWSNGTGPSDVDDVRISGDYSGGLECENLEVESGNTLTVSGESTLKVNGALTNNGSLIVESGSSLITYESNSFTGNPATIKRNTRYSDGKYSFVGTPVQQNAGMTAATLGSDVYTYDESQPYSTNDGLNRWIPATGELVPGVGYTQANQQEITFTGVPNVGDIVYSGTYTEDTEDANEAWNFISNPYPTAIDVADFLGENNDLSGAVYIWDDNGSNTQRGTNSDYIVANGTMATMTAAGGQTRYKFHIGSGQGFFVKLTEKTATDIFFVEDLRVSGFNSDDNFFRKEKPPTIRINLTNDQDLFKQAVVGFAEDATEDELNKTYDAQAFNASSDDGLFTMKAGRALSLNGMPTNWESIQLQLNTKEAGIYTISIELEGYDQYIYLRDNLSGEITDLRNGSYSFTSQVGINTDRFELISSSTDVLGVEEDKVLLYANNSILHIHQEGDSIREYQLFNMKGQQLLSTSVQSKGEVNLSSYAKGIYLVFDGQKTHKIILD